MDTGPGKESDLINNFLRKHSYSGSPGGPAPVVVYQVLCYELFRYPLTDLHNNTGEREVWSSPNWQSRKPRPRELSGLPKVTQRIRAELGLEPRLTGSRAWAPCSLSHVFLSLAEFGLRQAFTDLGSFGKESRFLFCQTSKQLLRVLHFVGHTAGRQYHFWSTGHDWCCYSGEIDQPHHFFKRKYTSEREKERLWYKRTERQSGEDWEIHNQRYFKGAHSGDTQSRASPSWAAVKDIL